MVLFLNFFGAEILLIFITIIVLLISRIKWQYQYWKRKGMPYLEPKSLFGNFGNPFNRSHHLGIIGQRLYTELKQMVVKQGGAYSFTSHQCIPIDPHILKNIMQNKFNYFQDRGFYYNEKDDPLSAHLFAISGPKWRKLRTILTPTFTSGKMKMMFDTLVNCAENMHEAIQKYEGNHERIDIKDVLARYTTDVIGSCAFGLECNSFKDNNAEFQKYGREIFRPMTKLESFIATFAFSKPDFARKIGFKLLPKHITTFYLNVVKDTVQYREENNVKRNDMLQVLIDLKVGASVDTQTHDGRALSINEIAAQAFVFFTAGFETSSTTMTFCLYELALNQDVQQRVRDEINTILIKYNGTMTYEALMDLKYMGQVIDETLRKYPPIAFLTRKCVEDYPVPETDITIEKDTFVFIPVYGFHHDPEYFPNPERFDPDRFSEANKSMIQPFTYIPFGEGPRLCIGMRFGLMQVKVGLLMLLKDYIFSLSSETVTPLDIDPYSFILTAAKGFWLKLQKVQQKSEIK